MGGEMSYFNTKVLDEGLKISRTVVGKMYISG
jgi:hypothetical protein